VSIFTKVSDLLNLPARMEVRLSVIDDALADLDAGVAEVSEELRELADAVEAGELNSEEVAAAIRERAQTLRDIRPDTPAPVTEEPAPGDDVPAEDEQV